MAQTGLITTVAGTGTYGYSGDGGPATAAKLNYPEAVAADAQGHLYIADSANNRVRKVAAGTGIITTVAGTGVPGFSGDGGPATGAMLDSPFGVAVDAAGNLYISDYDNNRVRKVAAGTGIITTLAGNGTRGFSGDGGPATGAKLDNPTGLAVDASGNLFISDRFNSRIRKVDAATGIITTVAGTGIFGLLDGEGGPATGANVRPEGLALDAAGNLYVADRGTRRIRKIEARTGIISTVAGGGMTRGGGPASSLFLDDPTGVVVEPTGNVFIADWGDHLILKLTTATRTVSAIAGGSAGFSGDGGPASRAQLNQPFGIALDAGGNLYLADTSNHRVRKISGIAALRPAMTAPAAGTVLSLSEGVRTTFAWTAVAGAAAHGFEYSGPNRQFANPNGAGPDPVNGFGGAGGGIVVPGTTVSVIVRPPAPTGTYQVRAIGLTPGGQPLGTFSDALPVIVFP